MLNGTRSGGERERSGRQTVHPVQGRRFAPSGGWQVVDEHHLAKDFRFPDFVRALAFTNRVGGMAEQQHHHPDIHLSWGHVRVEIWTHKIDGLTESDFVFA
ncbi:MAG: 4a-hydroxytetrahydrobiopterin dehydratase, partial [Deltaproteobacteria bacterium]|nr:4a-hydroxytetrahydrobiopterin dehydratase [Deltaproteobacteria bacterium]